MDRQLDVISHNLANASTLGYKLEKMTFTKALISQINGTQESSAESRAMSDLASVVTDFTAGSVIKTGSPLDVAINGKGFISVEGGNYTRRGDFRISSDGNLVTWNGLKVLGNGNPIKMPNGKVDVSSAGDIIVDGTHAGKLDLVDFADTSVLKKIEGGFFKSDQKGQPVMTEVRQGHLESSNVEVVREMVRMIAVTRQFETYEKAIHAFDDATSKVVNDMGRL